MNNGSSFALYQDYKGILILNLIPNYKIIIYKIIYIIIYWFFNKGTQVKLDENSKPLQIKENWGAKQPDYKFIVKEDAKPMLLHKKFTKKI